MIQRSNYRKFTDLLKKLLGNLDFRIIGKMHQIYTEDYIIRCVNKFPKSKLDLKPYQKSSYLFGICKKNAKMTDYKKNTKKIVTYE